MFLASGFHGLNQKDVVSSVGMHRQVGDELVCEFSFSEVTVFRSITVDLTGLPCGGNRTAIERLLVFGQDLHVMLQQLPALPSGQKEQLQTQLQVWSVCTYTHVYTHTYACSSSIALKYF